MAHSKRSRRQFLQLIGAAALLPLSLSGCDLLKGIVSPPTYPIQIQEIHVTLKEWEITPSSLQAKAGKVRFIVHNTGKMEHGFEVEGFIQGVKFEEEIEPFAAGQTKVLEVELAPGDYEVYCQVPGHKELGMKGKLVVKE